ncbi:hypothetical protein CABS01_08311 [Colletotrichum abscissum]|uniref:Uncharacterized protein n=3 Tax=Colletotrichum acutatum species complex TaxID=2707335 RepID=A0A9Q8SLH2_9PEZI|nr:hypothetical protein CMEL01_14190 [Colletotrichum melonis]KAK1509081.1 hypothetical protein CABS01_08311 [Colletotrichum abscissum]KAK1510428.1 hypothetical protein CCOS01_15259 [Colletotrichum costaricense]UQC78632.1 hypothetical protein CLUP02_04109 [Colletotrichum lupini]
MAPCRRPGSGTFSVQQKVISG